LRNLSDDEDGVDRMQDGCSLDTVRHN